MSTESTSVSFTSMQLSTLKTALRARIANLEAWLATDIEPDDSIAARAIGAAELDQCQAMFKKIQTADSRLYKKQVNAIADEMRAGRR